MAVEDIKAETPEGYREIPKITLFSEDKIKDAIMDRAFEKITYPEFLSHIAQVGVTHYNVDMHQRLVTYYNQDKSCFYQQKVPFFHEAQ